MAKTPEQIIELERDHAELSKGAFDAAKANANADLMSLNLGQLLKASLMQGLIAWRCGISSPVNAFKDGLCFLRQESQSWQLQSGTAQTLHFPLEKALFLTYLVNEQALAFDQKGLVADRLLDAILGYGLLDRWNEQSWTAGLVQLQKLKGSTLAVDTYMTYHQLLRSSHERDVMGIVEKSLSLFAKRRSNGFYSGGEQTDGGGPANPITVDYRLAAIMKKIGLKCDSVHSWQWG